MSDLSPALASLASAATALAGVARVRASTASDDSLLAYQRQVAASARLLEQVASTFAAEIDYRSRRELGYDGLAQRRGARTPEALVQQVTGMSLPAARRLVRVGTMVAEVAAHDAGGTCLTEPWLVDVLRVAASGGLSTEAVDAIRAGLGAPNDSVTTDALADAARALVAEATTLTLEALAARARELRDTLDTAGVAEREEERRSRRSLRLYPQPDGMTRFIGMLDPESAAVIGSAIDAATSPRRGGPRFVDASDDALAQKLASDPRTIEQLALDALVELVDVAVRAKGNTMLGVRRADVRLLVTQRDLDKRAGVGFIEGQKATVSIGTVERHACDGGFVPILFTDEGQSLNHGRTHRYHDTRQRTAIAARDGGCLGPDCDRPPSWCEVHHIVEFSQDGVTSVLDGVLLCKYHHLLMHNNGWRIVRKGFEYWLVPPPDIDVRQEPILLKTKSPAVRRLVATG